MNIALLIVLGIALAVAFTMGLHLTVRLLPKASSPALVWAVSGALRFGGMALALWVASRQEQERLLWITIGLVTTLFAQRVWWVTRGLKESKLATAHEL